MNRELRNELWGPLREKFVESLRSVLPVSLIVLGLSLTPWVDISAREMVRFSEATLLLVLGIGLFNQGADMAMTPMGQYVGEGLTSAKKMGLLLTVAFVMGLLITVAEPDLSVLASQVSAVMQGGLLIGTVGVGVGLMLLLGVIKIFFHHDLTSILMFLYMVLFCLAALLLSDPVKGQMLSMCFDAGGVTTGPITVPFIMALGVGIALTVGGRNASENSFGLIALCSVGPIAAVLLLSLLSSGAPSFQLPDYGAAEPVPHILAGAMADVAKSLVSIVLFFAVLQISVLHLPRTRLYQIGFGILYTYIGLVLFIAFIAWIVFECFLYKDAPAGIRLPKNYPDLRRQFARSVEGWDVVHRNTKSNELVQCNPKSFYELGALYDMKDCSTNVFFSLYSKRATAVGDLIFSKCYSEYYPQEKLQRRYDRVCTIFDGDPTEQEIAYLAEDLKIGAVLVTPYDGMWEKPGAIRTYYPRLIETPDYRVYLPE